ncbi:hypothetical protein [Wenzhouxiangella marina]|uniref:hypothetical protein n=1 Tax=Wenzhouxiangella marina TaxID=1579979 RepID=UPI0012E1E692|nr:hypothetical protein [Wenzhouxiangella marina]MBB6086789.1 hypothetical protein [Wenzhouxiangella marina]
MNKNIGWLAFACLFGWSQAKADDQFCSMILDFAGEASSGFASNQNRWVPNRVGRGGRYTCKVNLPGGSICSIKTRSDLSSNRMEFGYDQPSVASAENMARDFASAIETCGLVRLEDGAGWLSDIEDDDNVTDVVWHAYLQGDEDSDEYVLLEIYAWEPDSRSRRPPRAFVAISYERHD